MKLRITHNGVNQDTSAMSCTPCSVGKVLNVYEEEAAVWLWAYPHLLAPFSIGPANRFCSSSLAPGS